MVSLARSQRAVAMLLCVATAASVEQIRLAYTGILGQFSVDFVSNTSAGFLAYSVDNSSFTVVNTSSFIYAGIGYLHQAAMQFPALAGEPGFYRISSDGTTWTPVYEVVPVPATHPNERYAIFGDFGLRDDYCLGDIINSAKSGAFDVVLHVGDWAYNFEDANSTVGNDFMNLVQDYASVKPVMPAAGNHEACGDCPAAGELPFSANNFTQYRARMHSVTLYAGENCGSFNNLYYSFDQGLVHFLVFTAEAYAFNSGAEFISQQLAFMRNDLGRVNRSVTPWVVGLVHKDFTMQSNAYADFSPVLLAGQVDFIFVGHIHYYNRYQPFNPVTNEADTGCISPDGHTYTNPKYPTTIVVGSSGNHEKDHKCDTGHPFSMTCSQNYGWGVFQATNSTHATWSFHTVRPDGPGPANFTDFLTVVKTA